MTFNIAENIRRHGFKRLLLAVSGGLDSICLAHYFIENCKALGIEWLGIAHVHHGLREGTADRDAAFVEAFAKSHNVPFFLKRLDGNALKAAEGSLEENARDARYKALVEVVKNITTLDDDLIPHTGIVTAHHAGDLSETMYMRLRRGTTLAGLRGIQELRALSQDVAGLAIEAPLEGVAALRQAQGPLSLRMAKESEGEASPTPPTTYGLRPTVFIYRPFLNITRAELLDYAHEHNLRWCEDESNTDVKFARNKIRHEFLPHLEKEVPGATKQLCRIAELADNAYAKAIEKCEMLFKGTLEAPLAETHENLMAPSTAFASTSSANFTQDDNRAVSFASTSSANFTQDTIHAPLVSRLSSLISYIALDKKRLHKILLAHKDADLSEMFRLWLSEKGFRFPIGFFYSPKEHAHIKIPVHSVYRKRSIIKIRHTIWICEFKDALSAAKFVSCEM